MIHKSLMIGMKPKDAIKLDIIKLDQSEKYLQDNLPPEDGLYKYLYQPGEQHRHQKRRANEFIWSKKLYQSRVISFVTNCMMDLIELLYVMN